MSNLYGVFYPPPVGYFGRDEKWALLRNKRVAIRVARIIKGYVLSRTDVPEIRDWDAPTFKIGAAKVADFRERTQP